MELSTRIKYLSFILIGVIFVITGFALKELDIIAKVSPNNFSDWYQFIQPWVGNPNNGGLPTPWD